MNKNASELPHAEKSWRLYCLLWMVAPLLFFTFSANIIWTYALPALPGFALLAAEYLKQTKYRGVLALLVPVGFLALVLAYQFSNHYFFRTQKPLMMAYQQTAKAGEKLFYVDDRPYSAQFYLQGKALELKGISALQQNLTESQQNFYVIHQNTLEQLPTAIKPHLTVVKSYGKYSLFHGKP